MRHRTTPRFGETFDGLPAEIQELAHENFGVLKANPHHPSLQLKKAGEFWSVRIGLNYRAVAHADAEGLVWFWIGTHAEYDRIVGRKA